jgi:hypothetical protein
MLRSRLRIALTGALHALVFFALSSPARAENEEDPRRYEVAGFPILAGTTDVGFQFGVAGTLTRFYDRAFPYAWNIDLLLSASIKDQAGGVNLTQQSHVLRLDAPNLFGSRIRLDTRASFQQTTDAGYFGIGNGTSAEAVNKLNQFLYEYEPLEVRLRSIARAPTGIHGLDYAAGINLRYERPTAYSPSSSLPVGSTLYEDLARGTSNGQAVIGGRPAFLPGLSAGFMYDTRDSEFVTQQGVFYQLGLGGTVGTAEQVAYGEASAVLSHFAQIWGPIIFASRFIASLEFGRVPFYDLMQGGTFEPQYLVGSETGVRGVPLGRYAGRVKVVSNLEIRTTPFPRFVLLGDRFRIGTTTFFDAGRVWSDYVATSAADGNSLNLKYGVGGGVFLQWGEAAIFRVEAAYSPDAAQVNPGFPLGLYVSDGLMF